MTQREYFKAFRQLCLAEVELTNRKNRNYANADNALANFDLIESLTNGKVSRELGILVRMSDKLSRVATLLCGQPDLVGEALEDTLQDLGIYSKIEILALREKQGRTPTPQAPSGRKRGPSSRGRRQGKLQSS
jgi:hypothetical protein